MNKTVDDLKELLERILNYGRAYEAIGLKSPLLKITPYEHAIFKQYLLGNFLFNPKYYGDLPTYMGVNFQLVGNPVLFDGTHIRSDTGLELT